MSDAAGPGSDSHDAKALVAQVFTDSAESYDQVIDFFAPFGQALVSGAGLLPGAQVLDVACGRGACLFPAVEAVGPDGFVTGVDLAPGMIGALAQDLASRRITNAAVHVGDAEALDLADASMDAVLAGFMIFFCPDPERVLAEFARVLRPGGVVALTTFDGETPSKFLRDVGAELFGEQDRRASEEFDRAEVLDPALVRAGFEQPTGTDVVEQFRFDSGEQMERWHRSHFARLLLDVLDDDQLAVYRRRRDEHLETLRVGDHFVMPQRARVTVARKP
ncbi:class I SAM-dependent methyltransferase [Aquihabitans daechungensis]|uniref:class I SAM-dependent methyltransferase n=1 Tax=Aquihabitans daechungensis TaxID=1052257 RepID=UPI003BA32E95